MKHFLEVDHLTVSFKSDSGKAKVVDDISYYVDSGEIVSFVGESGSGKSVAQLATLQLIASPPGNIDSGKILLEGENLLDHKPESDYMRHVRGGKIGMVFQEPMTSLDPIKTIGYQLTESILVHSRLSRKEAEQRAEELLHDVGISDARSRLNDYPHQFSGGMRQRIMIAMAISGNPKMIIADEPTTALDVTTQAQILELLKGITEKYHTALLIVTHNLGIVARYAQRIYVVYSGVIVEQGMAADIFSHPSHPYTRSLLKAVPRLDDPKDRRLVPISGIPLAPANRILGCPFYNRCKYRGENCSDKIRPEFRTGKGKEHLSACVLSEEQLDRADFGTKSLKITGKDCSKNSVIVEVKDLEVKFRKNKPGKQASWLKILDQVSFEIREGETLGLVGESGCGKSTVARSILQLIPYTGGYVRYKGADLKNYKKKQLRAIRKKIQMIFQDPYSSLDPRQSAGDIVGEALKIHGLTRTKEQYDKRIEELFELVGLDIDMKKRVAHEFSGGQRQRLGIARALACDPEFIICDEPVSALDVSIQAQIINLLEDLQRKLGLTYLFIAHDLSVIKHISDVVAVMYLGKIIEISKCEEIYNNPMHPYTKALMEAVPIPDPLVEAERKIVPLTGEVPSIVKRPEGCCFHERCPFVMERCRREIPPLIREKENHQVACFLYERK